MKDHGRRRTVGAGERCFLSGSRSRSGLFRRRAPCVRLIQFTVGHEEAVRLHQPEPGGRAHHDRAGAAHGHPSQRAPAPAADGHSGGPWRPPRAVLSHPVRQPSRYGWHRVDPPQRPVLLVNPRSGSGAAGRAGLAERASDKGIEVILFRSGQDLAELAGAAVASGADALGMAGGDGSLAVVAAIAAAHGLPFVCVPAGTRNHFALDLGVDRHDLAGALDAFTDGVERSIDIAEVNRRTFLNNVSLGIYGEAVRKSAYRDAKLRTLAETAEKVLGPSSQAPALRLTDDAGREHRHLSILLVSNNPYATERPLVRGTRPALDTGQLGILVLDLPEEGYRPPGRIWRSPSLQVDAAGPVHAGIDGEAADLSPPLRFTIRHAALRVRISARHPGASPSARFPFAAPPAQEE